jgi:hypothetical protein
MNKHEMRQYIAELETRVDMALNKWKKESRIENGEAVQIEWQYEQSHVIIDVFWEDDAESIVLQCINPRFGWRHHWKSLSKENVNRIMDRVGNFAQIIQTKTKE